MSIYCPNKTSPEYISLLEEVGPDKIDLEWDLRYGSKIDILDTKVYKFKNKTFKGDPKKLNKSSLKALFKISSYKNVSRKNISLIRGRIKLFNTLYDTSHSLPEYRVGQSLSYNIDLVVNNTPYNKEFRRQNDIRRSNPDNPIDVSSNLNSVIEDPNKAKLKAANERLGKILQSLGVETRFLADFKSKYGVDANGVADIMRKIIEINDMAYLPEEAAHMIFEMINNTSLQEGLLNLARQSEEYKKVWKEYGEIYNNDELKIAKETAGKLLAKGFLHTAQNPVITNETDVLIRRIVMSAKAIWNKIKSIFEKNPSIVYNIQDLYNEVAANIYNNNIELDQNKPTENNVFFSKKATDFMSKADDAKSMVERSIKLLKNKIKINETRASKEESKVDNYVTKTEELISDLEEKLNNAEYVNGIQTFLNTVTKEMTGKSKPNLADVTLLQKNINKLKEKVDEGKTSYNIIAKELKVMYNHYQAYKPIIDKINISFQKDPNFIEDLKKVLSDEQINILQSQVNTINGQLTYLKDQHDNLAKILTTKIFLIESKQDNIKLDKDGNLESLTLVLKDESWLQRSVNAMAESNDELLRLIDTINKESKHRARLEHTDLSTDILNKFDSLKSKISDFSYIAEKDEKGVPTGYFLSKYNKSEYLKEYNKFYKNWEGNTGTKEFKAEQIKFHKKNGTVTKPADKFLNKTYATLSKDQKEYLEYLKNIKIELEKGLPSKFKTGNLLPQYRKDLFERLKEDPKNIGNTLLDNLKDREDDTEFGNTLKDELGNPINFLPVYGTSKLENLNDLSTDVTSTLILHAKYIMDFKEMNKVIHALELMKDIANSRTVIKKDKVSTEDLENLSLSELKEKYNNVEGVRSNNFRWVEDFFNMQVYGKMKLQKEFTTTGNFTIPFTDTKINVVKAIDTFASYVGLNSLGANLYSIINNVVLGRLMTNLEGITGQYYNLKYLYAADAKLADWRILDDVGRKVPKSKAMIWNRYFNATQEYDSDVYDINADRKTKAGRLLNRNLLFAGQKAGEFNIQMRTSIGLAESIKLKDKSGNEVSFYDAFEAKDGKLILNESLTISESNRLFGENRIGTKINKDDIINFTKIQDRINQKLHGIYNTADKSAMQQYAVGRLVIMFRKFLVPAFNRRFSSKKFNEDLGEYDQGYYNALGRYIGIIKSDLKVAKAQLLGLQSLDNLSEEQIKEIYDLRRSLLELGTFVGLLVLTTFILDDLEPDDDDWATHMFIYQTNRLYTEVAAFTPTPFFAREMLTLTKSPAAAVNQLESVSRLLNHVMHPDSWTKDITKGSYEGMSQVEKSAIQLLPLEKNIRSWFNPKEKNNFFNRK